MSEVGRSKLLFIPLLILRLSFRSKLPLCVARLSGIRAVELRARISSCRRWSSSFFLLLNFRLGVAESVARRLGRRVGTGCRFGNSFTGDEGEAGGRFSYCGMPP